MGGQPRTTTNVTETKLTEEQQALVDLAMPRLKEFAANPPQWPPFSQVAGFDPLQTQGQEQALGAVPAQQTLANIGGVGQGFLSSGAALFPETNPALRGTIEAAIRPISETLLTDTLPGIRSEFVNAGQYGGSRQGIAEGLAFRGAEQAAADAASKIASENYQAGLGEMTKSLGLLPQTIGAQVQPALTTSGVGDVRQALAQALLSEQGAKYNYEQLLPYLIGSDLISLSGGVPGGSTVSTATAPGPSPLSTALGIATLGATLLGSGGALAPGGFLASLFV